MSLPLSNPAMSVLIFQALLYLAFPVAAIYLARRYRVFEWLSPVLLCYLVGMLIANLSGLAVDEGTARAATDASIPLAIPLLLFSSDFFGWLEHGKAAVKSFAIAVGAVFIASTIGALVFAGYTDEFWKVAGMLVGVYTGGTPNMLSIGLALDVADETFILINAADVVFGGIYLLVLLSVAKPILSRFTPEFEPAEGEKEPGKNDDKAPARERARGMVIGFFVSAGILVVSAGLSMALGGDLLGGVGHIVDGDVVGGLTVIFSGELDVALVILGITTGGIAFSFVPRVHELPGTYELGNYFILVFCVAMGTLTDFEKLFEAGGIYLAYVGLVMAIAIIIHFGAGILFKIDCDTLIITSVAAVYGPPFVAPIAEAIDNRYVILSGLTTGLIGYALGNYLGIAFAHLLYTTGWP
ncbi:MAG: DUF819 family protein [Myxococcota bacterium]